MPLPHKMLQLLLDSCRTKYSWASGARRGTPSTRELLQKDLDIAIGEIDGLMTGMHYQDHYQDQQRRLSAQQVQSRHI